MNSAGRPLWRDGRILLLAILFFVQASAALRLDSWMKPRVPALETRGEAPRFASTVRAAADLGGVRVLVGHFFWFGVLQYYGDSTHARERYVRLYELCSLAADLNPHYVPIYTYGAAPLAFHVQRPDEAVALLERGIRANPGATQLSLMLAAIGYQNRSEWDRVIPLLEAQIVSGQAPVMMVNILANTYKKAGRLDDALRLWRRIQKAATTDEQRITAAEKLRELYELKRGGAR